MVGIASAADAAQIERSIAMPAPERAARRGVLVGQYMGLSKHQAAMMVMTAASAAEASAIQDGCSDVTWLKAIHREASLIYAKSRPAGVG